MRAELIGSDRNAVAQFVSGIVGFFKSDYFRNVRNSLMLFMGAWVWYVFNTQTYTPPEYDD